MVDDSEQRERGASTGGPGTAEDGAAGVLAVDMDGTLVRTDTLAEATLALIAAEPWRVPQILGWLRLGRAGFKRRLADHRLADPASLPYDEAVTAEIAAARAAGRRIELVSAADARQVRAVADHLALFDTAHGTSPGTAGGANLGGAEKAAFLAGRHGAGGFDYVGDSRTDLPVWARARRAITAHAGSGLRAAAERARPGARHISPPAGRAAEARAWLRALRPHQWLKNLLVFLPVLAAHAPAAAGPALVAFVAFSLTASSVYLLNDLLDLAADRAHPRKRHRPFAAGTLGLAEGAVAAGALLLAAATLAGFALPPQFLAVLGLYLTATLAYSLALKRRLIIDVWTLAGLYTLRILAGAAATGIALSPWMLAFSMFLFLSLATVKRQAEMVDLRAAGTAQAAGRAYRTEDLPILAGMALAAGYAAVLVLALYINSPRVEALYARPLALWPVCALLLYWISRMVMVTHRGGMGDDPLVFALRDRVSLAVIALSGVAVMTAWGGGA